MFFLTGHVTCYLRSVSYRAICLFTWSHFFSVIINLLYFYATAPFPDFALSVLPFLSLLLSPFEGYLESSPCSSFHASPASTPGTLFSPPSYHLPLAFHRELHSTSGPLMDDEWSKGCECMESALLPFLSPPAFSLSPHTRLRVSSESEKEKEREDRCINVSPRRSTPAASRYMPSRPVYGAAMMVPTSPDAPAHSVRDIN